MNGSIFAGAKRAFSTRNVPASDFAGLTTDAQPKAGDLVLARVTEIGHHTKIERPDGRKAKMFLGDLIIVAYGNRYAPDQFESELPEDLSPCHLVAAGGIASRALAWHDRILKPTSIEPVGMITNQEGEVINLRHYQVEDKPAAFKRPNIYLVAGTAMNAGKTTTAAFLINGLKAAGQCVAALKVTGTGAGGDLWLMQDAGADFALDFTDAGMATSYLEDIDYVKQSTRKLVNFVASQGVDSIVIEVADGLLQRETHALLIDEDFNKMVDCAIFTARDAMSAIEGVRWLGQHHYPVAFVGGVISRSPLARREAESAIGLPIYGLEQLVDPEMILPALGMQLSKSA
ncbi:P-loop NTPase family protein [Salinibius halmophilus]|uniref:molybdopterin guanine dinucleotide synthesis B family protein n=1 Tax=Salinibius halmophilus TaxID=1853216 RepID=UPI000E673EA2|nr:molybdopterin guanine dinucleotide synthesis B family protein [Salinibius halmophilus]